MKRAVYSMVTVAAIGAALWWLLVAPNVLPDAVREGMPRTPAKQAGQRGSVPARHDASDEARHAPPIRDASHDLRTQFRASSDYWEFAERIFEAAKKGDGASQYYLSVALNTCDFLYRYYFMEQKPGARPRIRTLDEAQQLTATRQGSAFTPEDVRDIETRCQRIMNTAPPPFGTSAEWMTAAQNSGYPLALVQAAANKAIQGRFDASAEKARAARSEARALVVEALQSRDAEVLSQLAPTAAFLAGDEPGEIFKRQWIWLMAAHQRDPGGDSMFEWRKLHCSIEAQCHPDDTILDLIRRGAGNDFDEIERRARELNEKIDAGTFDESDI